MVVVLLNVTAVHPILITSRIITITKQWSEARENTSDQVVIGFSFASDWLRKRSKFSGPITQERRVNQAISDSFQHSFENCLTTCWNSQFLNYCGIFINL